MMTREKVATAVVWPLNKNAKIRLVTWDVHGEVQLKGVWSISEPWLGSDIEDLVPVGCAIELEHAEWVQPKRAELSGRSKAPFDTAVVPIRAERSLEARVEQLETMNRYKVRRAKERKLREQEEAREREETAAREAAALAAVEEGVTDDDDTVVEEAPSEEA